MSKAEKRNLNVLVYAAGYTAWVYQTKGKTIAEIMADGHFDDDLGESFFTSGDTIMIVADEGNKLIYVVEASEHHVRVASLL